MKVMLNGTRNSTTHMVSQAPMTSKRRCIGTFHGVQFIFIFLNY